MSCETYRESLTDAAVSGEFAPALRHHLTACTSCRSAFEREESLLVALDAGVRASVNASVPASLAARVRAEIVKEPAPHRPVTLPWAFAVAALAAGAILAAIYLPHARNVPAANPIATLRPPATTSANSVQPPRLNTLFPGGVKSSQHDGAVTVVSVSKSIPPQVIVAPEEGAALLRYETLLRGIAARKSQVLAAKSLEVSAGITPLEITELELGDLKIPALSKSESEGDSK
ncbi:MAG TPA: hypothetical protein VKT53_12535 [Candidatus Acidoferrum sp.]|nr:hypothetical protein [Candidatus Acidoferrum sp.]